MPLDRHQNMRVCKNENYISWGGRFLWPCPSSRNWMGGGGEGVNKRRLLQHSASLCAKFWWRHCDSWHVIFQDLRVCSSVSRSQGLNMLFRPVFLSENVLSAQCLSPTFLTCPSSASARLFRLHCYLSCACSSSARLFRLHKACHLISWPVPPLQDLFRLHKACHL